ncbi:MAG: YihY/virulence factor BrkB family protein, partial [Lachnospiraceae bacterium]|nr:YihY/virulence factor BrkB family protein [Lachnospiraceae bacterium]
VVFAILLVLALIFMAAWHPLRRELLQLRPKGISLYVFATAIRAVYSIVLLTLGIAVMYKVFPHRKLRFLRQLPGAFFSAAAWYIFSMIVQLYVTKLKGFSTYGSLTTLMLVMFWLYFCCYFVMLGAEINEMLRRDGLLAKTKKKQAEKPASAGGGFLMCAGTVPGFLRDGSQRIAMQSSRTVPAGILGTVPP